MTNRRLKNRRTEVIIANLRDADAMPNTGTELAAVLQKLEIGEATIERWRKHYCGIKREEAKRLKLFEKRNDRLKRLIAALSLDNQMPNQLVE